MRLLEYPGRKFPDEEDITSPDVLRKWWTKYVNGVGRTFHNIGTILNGRIGFGDGSDLSDADNFAGVVRVVTTAGAGVEVTVSHTLGVIPIGFILIVPPGSGVVNKGGTAWTTSNIFLTCTSATQTFTIVILAPSHGA